MLPTDMSLANKRKMSLTTLCIFLEWDSFSTKQAEFSMAAGEETEFLCNGGPKSEAKFPDKCRVAAVPQQTQMKAQ